eukprot:TRINITY_DN32856_c0_g1_i1.p1 TRINITY_DN32856_c0_g1~~TRINITY_DN32856_c0_g1_i1.p1  ORF type:complete len:1014 (+),score=265.51 TRINITY_DN32856_c0_g1_i1:87-3128(+)
MDGAGYVEGDPRAPGGPGGRTESMRSSEGTTFGMSVGHSVPAIAPAGPPQPSLARPTVPQRKGSVSGGSGPGRGRGEAAQMSPPRREGGIQASLVRPQYTVPATHAASGLPPPLSPRREAVRLPDPSSQAPPVPVAPQRVAYDRGEPAVQGGAAAPPPRQDGGRSLEGFLRSAAVAQLKKAREAQAAHAAEDRVSFDAAFAKNMPAEGRGAGADRLAAVLGTHFNTDALTALQRNDPAVQDPLLEQLDPYLRARAPAAPPVAAEPLPLVRGWAEEQRQHPPRLAEYERDELCEADLRHLRPKQLRDLVDGAAAAEPERLDISPPPKPRSRQASPRRAPRHVGTGVGPASYYDAADATVRAVENKAVAAAAHDMTLEDLDRADVTRQALQEYYRSNNDVLLGAHPMHVLIPDELQRAALVDPTVSPRRPHPGSAVAVAAARHASPDVDIDVFPLEESTQYSMLSTSTNKGPVKKLDAPDPVRGASKALIIGVTYTGTPYAIPDSALNVQRVKTCLAQYGFYGEQIVLCDNGEGDAATQPTYANILAALKWLVQSAEHGESFFLYYCGRGQQRDPAADHTDLLPCDYETAGAMPDHAINDILLTFLPQGARLTVVADCYPGGQVLALPFKVIGDRDGSVRVTRDKPGDCVADVVQISGQRPRGTAAVDEGETLQDLTGVLCNLLARDPRPSYRTLLLTLRDGLLQTSDYNTPVIATSRPVDFKDGIFVLGAPETTLDTRLISAKRRTKEIASHLSKAEKARAEAAEEKERSHRKRLKERDDATREALRVRNLRHATQGLADTLSREVLNRTKLVDAEAAARHDLQRVQMQNQDFLLSEAMNNTGWNRIAAPDSTDMPIVAGVKWQRVSEKQQEPRADQIEKQYQPGQHVRTFSVLPKRKQQALRVDPRLSLAEIAADVASKKGLYSPGASLPRGRHSPRRLHDPPSVTSTPKHGAAWPPPMPQLDRSETPQYRPEAFASLPSPAAPIPSVPSYVSRALGGVSPPRAGHSAFPSYP